MWGLLSSTLSACISIYINIILSGYSTPLEKSLHYKHKQQHAQ